MSQEQKIVQINPTVQLQELALKSEHDNAYYWNRVRELAQLNADKDCTIEAQSQRIEELELEVTRFKEDQN